MSLKRMVAATGIVVLTVLGGGSAETSWAQSAQSGRPHKPTAHRMRPYVVITPGPLLYRRCVDWLETQYRPSGTVLYPQYRCWWVRG
jgi:hypothetical protein